MVVSAESAGTTCVFIIHAVFGTLFKTIPAQTLKLDPACGTLAAGVAGPEAEPLLVWISGRHSALLPKLLARLAEGAC